MFLFLILFSLISCKSMEYLNINEHSPEIKNNFFISSDGYSHSLKTWVSEEKSNYVIIAIHGYSDYSNAFDIPSEHFNKFNIDMYSFDLRGFGSNIDNGTWVDPQLHEKDIIEFIDIIINKNMGKKIFLLGESMGGILVINSIIDKKKLDIEGVILVAPAIWNFSEKNFFKSTFLSVASFLLPNLTVEGSTLVKIKPSDNLEMLREFSRDPKVVHKKSLKSLNGIKKLMDSSYKNFVSYLNLPTFKTLLIVPLNDQIIPRKPLIEIIDKTSFKEQYSSDQLKIAAFEGYYHMILRDIDGTRVTNEIKDWIIQPNSLNFKVSSANSLEKIMSKPFYHELD